MKTKTYLILSIIVSISISCKQNQAPQVTSVNSDAETIVGGSIVHLDIDASDEEGDLLTYSWSASGGKFLSRTNKNTVTWLAPTEIENQTYSITVEVSDGELKTNNSIELFVEGGKFIDQRDGIIYNFVQIGDQLWMAENLRATTFQNGDSITLATSPHEWKDGWKDQGSACCCLEFDEENASKLGMIYNGFAVTDSRALAPEGWHVSTDDDWIELLVYLGMEEEEATGCRTMGTNEGTKLKDPNDPKWKLTESENIEFSGFDALVGGAIMHTGYFVFKITSALFWTSTQTSDQTMLAIGIHQAPTINRCDDLKKLGGSVRCVKDK